MARIWMFAVTLLKALAALSVLTAQKAQTNIGMKYATHWTNEQALRNIGLENPLDWTYQQALRLYHPNNQTLHLVDKTAVKILLEPWKACQHR